MKVQQLVTLAQMSTAKLSRALSEEVIHQLEQAYLFRWLMTQDEAHRPKALLTFVAAGEELFKRQSEVR